MHSPDKPSRSLLGTLGACWGIAGVTALLGSAIVRLGQITQEALLSGNYTLETHHWAFTVIWLIFMVYSEGIRGFQKKFSPRVVARANHLSYQRNILHIFLAPLFCMGYFHATRKRMIVSYTLTAMIVCLILIVRQFEQPWRGMIDLGVISGLAWGLACIWLNCFRLITTGVFDHDPEVPESAAS